MSTPPNPPPEMPNTYLVQDRSQGKELTRVHLQDQLLTAGMGGVLVEQADPTLFRQVLDVGCGTGNWLIEVAKAYPEISQLVGVDTSGQVIAYARDQAEAQQVADRVTFRIMDALRMLEFPTDTFDLVNQRLGMSYLRTWDWPNLLSEYKRVTKTDGIVRVTESDLTENNSPALTRLLELLLDAFYQAGYFFTHQKDGVIRELPSLFERQGFQQIQTHAHKIIYRAGTSEGERYSEDMKHIFRLVLPFIQKWVRVPNNYEEIYQQALREMQDPGFEVRSTMLTIWGINPPKALLLPSNAHD